MNLARRFHRVLWLRAQIAACTFSQNTAKSSGSVLLADDDSQVSISGSSITNNGNYSCYDPPVVCLTLSAVPIAFPDMKARCWIGQAWLCGSEAPVLHGKLLLMIDDQADLRMISANSTRPHTH